jgi:hypothetical protein
MGHSESAISANGMDGYSTIGNSFFDIFFTVDAPALYDLDASVNWVGGVPPFGFSSFAFVELRDFTNGSGLAFIQRDPGTQGLGTLSTTVSLTTGITYRLVAQALINGAGGLPVTSTATADWSFDLVTAIPEAGGALLLSPIVLAAALGVWWSRRRCQH